MSFNESKNQSDPFRSPPFVITRYIIHAFIIFHPHYLAFAFAFATLDANNFSCSFRSSSVMAEFKSDFLTRDALLLDAFLWFVRDRLVEDAVPVRAV